MSETPRTDAAEWSSGKNLADCQLVVFSGFARQLETELADKDRQLAEARAEIERLKLVSQNQETVIAAQRRSAKAKNELIEQMREALRLTADEYSLHVSRYENRNAHDDQCYIVAEQALAAERGE